jgi:hypothetical protein
MSRFAEVAADFCGTDPSAIVIEPAGEWPPGAVLDQSPKRGTTFLCGTTRLSVTLAADTPPPVLLVPAFTSSDDMARFAEVAAKLCRTDPSAIATAIITEPAGEWPPGAVLEQSPQRGTTFLCGATALSLTLAAEPTPPVWKPLLLLALAALGIAAILVKAIPRLLRVVPGNGNIQASLVGDRTSPQPLLAVRLSQLDIRANLLGALPGVVEGPFP